MKMSGLQFLLGVSAASLLTAAGVTWRAGAAPDSVPPPAQPTSALHQVNLEFRLAEFRLESQTLNQVIDDLAKKTGENFAIDWAALSYGDLNLSRQTILPMTLKLRNVTLREALDAVIHRLSDDPYQIYYEASDGIITLNRLGRRYDVPVTRVYDVRDLIERQRTTMHERHLPPNKSPAEMDVPANEYQAAADWIIATAQDALSERSEDARFSELAGRLIVTTTPETHLWIERFFADLRNTAGLVKH